MFYVISLFRQCAKRSLIIDLLLLTRALFLSSRLWIWTNFPTKFQQAVATFKLLKEWADTLTMKSYLCAVAIIVRYTFFKSSCISKISCLDCLDFRPDPARSEVWTNFRKFKEATRGAIRTRDEASVRTKGAFPWGFPRSGLAYHYPGSCYSRDI